MLSELSTLGKPALLLDGDELREVFAHQQLTQNYDRLSRINLAMNYSKLCKLLSSQDVIIIIATISLFQEIHLWNRENIENYFEIFLDIPIQTLMQRDSKHIYTGYKNGKIKNVAGLDLAVDYPIKPDIHMTNFELKDLCHKTRDALDIFFKKLNQI